MKHILFNVGMLKQAIADLPDSYIVQIMVNTDHYKPNVAHFVVDVEHWDNPKDNKDGRVYIRNYTEQDNNM